jgi:hypothetical protein
MLKKSQRRKKMTEETTTTTWLDDMYKATERALNDGVPLGVVYGTLCTIQKEVGTMFEMIIVDRMNSSEEVQVEEPEEEEQNE